MVVEGVWYSKNNSPVTKFLNNTLLFAGRGLLSARGHMTNNLADLYFEEG